MKILAITLSVAFLSSVALTNAAFADRMNGKGNCAGGVCTGGGSLWNSGGAKPPPKAAKTTKVKNN